MSQNTSPVSSVKTDADSPACVFTPDQVVEALLGVSGVTLHGFDDLDCALDTKVPVVPIHLSVKEQERLIRHLWLKRCLRIGGLIALLCALTFAAAFGYRLATNLAPSQSQVHRTR